MNEWVWMRAWRNDWMNEPAPWEAYVARQLNEYRNRHWAVCLSSHGDSSTTLEYDIRINLQLFACTSVWVYCVSIPPRPCSKKAHFATNEMETAVSPPRDLKPWGDGNWKGFVELIPIYIYCEYCDSGKGRRSDCPHRIELPYAS